MKAVLLNGYGGVDQLEYKDVPDPIPQAGEVLLRVISTSVNPIDFKIREGVMRERLHLSFPAILGRDVSGVVIGLGPGVGRFKEGDHVIGFVGRTYAEQVACEAEALTFLPQDLDSIEAGALPLVTITGAQLIERGVQPRAGETVLVTGALGGVGRTAVYVAKEHGCKVIAGVRAKQKADAAVVHADAVVALDKDDEIALLPELDAIADTVAGETAGKIAPKLKKDGIFASVLGEPDAAKKAGVQVRGVLSQPDPARLHELAAAIRDGKLSVPISQRMRLSQIREAHTAAEKGVKGKILLIP